MKYSLYKLKNGIEVVSYHIKGIRSVTLSIGILGGAGYEEKDKQGTLHFLEHVLLGGSKRYPTVMDLRVKAEELGLTFNGSVSSLQTTFWFSFPDNKVKESLEFIAEVLTNPLFAQDEIEKTRNVILTEQNDFWDVPDNRFYVKANEEFYGSNEYFTPGFGSREVVEKITKNDLVSTYKRYYNPKNIKLSVAGNVKSELINEYLDDVLRKWKSSGKEEKLLKPTTSVHNKTYFVFHEPRKQVRFYLSFPSVGYKELSLKQRYLYGIFYYLFGGGLTSILIKRLREDLGLVYGVNAAYAPFSYFGNTYIHGSVDSANLEKTLEEIFQLILHVQKDGISQKDFKRAVSFLSSQIFIGFGGSAQISEEFLSALLAKEEIFMPSQKIKTLKSITYEEVIEFGKAAFDLQSCSIALMGDQDLINDSNSEKIYKRYTT